MRFVVEFRAYDGAWVPTARFAIRPHAEDYAQELNRRCEFDHARYRVRYGAPIVELEGEETHG